MSVGLLLLRIVVGSLMVGHGTQKLFGWFRGPGPKGATDFVASLGYRPAAPLAILLAVAEAGGGLLIMTGLLLPIGAAVVGGVLLNAIVAVHWSKGLWNTDGGYELPLLLWAASLALSFTGPGAYSIDRGLGFEMGGVIPGLYALSSAVMLGGVGLALRGRHEALEASERPQRRQRAA